MSIKTPSCRDFCIFTLLFIYNLIYDFTYELLNDLTLFQGNLQASWNYSLAPNPSFKMKVLLILAKNFLKTNDWAVPVVRYLPGIIKKFIRKC